MIKIDKPPREDAIAKEIKAIIDNNKAYNIKVKQQPYLYWIFLTITTIIITLLLT